MSGYYMILIEILDDRLRSMDNELTKHVEVIRGKNGIIIVIHIMPLVML